MSDPLAPSGNLRRRLVVNWIAEGSATLAALAAVAVLGVVVYSVIKNAAPVLRPGFLVHDPPVLPGAGGGIGPAIVGTALLVALATAIAAPLGILIALFTTEFARGTRAAAFVRLVLDLMNGLPSIVIGVFIFGALVAGHGQSGLAGSVALSIIMLPLVARSAQEVLLLVPATLREASEALGVARWRGVLGVILPSALGGILTGTLLAVARAAGETAPLLLVCSIVSNGLSVNPFSFGRGLPNIPVTIFEASEQADPGSYARAWGAAFVLLAFILVTNVLARTLLMRSRRKLGA